MTTTAEILGRCDQREVRRVMRTPEQGHTKACLARALLCVIENRRDNTQMSDVEFVLSIQDSTTNETILQEAFRYFDEHMLECTCPAYYTHKIAFSDGSEYETRNESDIRFYTNAMEQETDVADEWAPGVYVTAVIVL
jgi:hypothetical protein